MKRAFFTAAAIGLLSALPACNSDTVRAPSSGYSDPLAPHDYPNVVFQDQLDEDLVVHEPPNVRPASDSLPMRVRLTLRSVSDDTTNCKVKFVFYGADGASLTDNPVWQPYAILPRSRQYIEGNSISLSAVRWEAQVARN